MNLISILFAYLYQVADSGNGASRSTLEFTLPKGNTRYRNSITLGERSEDAMIDSVYLPSTHWRILVMSLVSPKPINTDKCFCKIIMRPKQTDMWFFDGIHTGYQRQKC